MYSSLAELVAQRRTALGYTVRQLAARVGVSPAYIVDIEDGRITTPTPPVLGALARELLISEEELLRVIGYARRPDKPSDRIPSRPSVAQLLAMLARELHISEEDLLRAMYLRRSVEPNHRIPPQRSVAQMLAALARELDISEEDLLRAMRHSRSSGEPNDQIPLRPAVAQLLATLARELHISEETLLRAIRTAMGELAAAGGVSSAYIPHIEHGRIATPSPAVLAALARELDVSEETLLRAIGYLRPSSKPNDQAPPRKSLAHLVKQARKARGLTQVQVDQLIGVSNGYTGMVENGQIERPRPETLHRLEIVLGISREEMLAATGELDMPSEDLTIVIQRIAALPSRQQRLEAWARLPESLRNAVLVLMQDLLHRPDK